MPRGSRALALLLGVALLSGCATPTPAGGVHIEYNVHGPLALEQGGRLDIDVRVVGNDSRMPLPGFPVEAVGLGGAATMGNDRGLTYVRFQADRDLPPPYEIRISAGTDAVVLRIEAGYSFTETRVGASTADGIEVSEVWIGRVCGDPFAEPWAFHRVVNETDVQNRYDLVEKPRLLDDRGDRATGVVPMIAANPAEREGEPPFILYLDDVEPSPFEPASQRVPVVVTPLSWAECA